MRQLFLAGICVVMFASCFEEEQAVTPCTVSSNCPSGKPFCDGDLGGTGVRGCRKCAAAGASECGDRPAGEDVCVPEDGICAECAGDGDCAHKPDNKVQCSAAHVCVQPCDGNEDCSAPTPLCKTSTSRCVQCLEMGDCAGVSGKLQCRLDTNACVQCLNDGQCSGGDVCDLSGDAMANTCVKCNVDDDCDSASAAKCNTTTHECEECDHGNIEQCAGTAGLPAGNDSVCKNGTCVDCSVASQDDTCDSGEICNPESNACVQCLVNADCAGVAGLLGNNFCDTAVAGGTCKDCSGSGNASTTAAECPLLDGCNAGTKACNGVGAGSRTDCQRCSADAQCTSSGGTRRCVPMFYAKAPFSGGRYPLVTVGFCLETTASGCSRPYSIDTPSRTSLSSAGATTYCGVNESLTTCDAVKALFDDMPLCEIGGADSLCPTGGLCRKVGSLTDSNRCTYECEGSAQCPSFAPGNTCGPGTTGGPDYCGGLPPS